MKRLSEAEKARRARLPFLPIRHGMYKTPEYSAWLSMKQRCQNPNHPCFHLYGGRGIKVCARWEQFERFFFDMGKRPSPKHTIERTNNSRGYEPENCIWATQQQQVENTRRTIWVIANGKSMCLKRACRDIWCVDYVRVRRRLVAGWNVEEAVNTPVLSQYRKKSYVARIQPHEPSRSPTI